MMVLPAVPVLSPTWSHQPGLQIGGALDRTSQHFGGYRLVPLMGEVYWFESREIPDTWICSKVQQDSNCRNVAKERRFVKGRLSGRIARIHVPSNPSQIAQSRNEVLEVPVATGVQNRRSRVWVGARLQ